MFAGFYSIISAINGRFETAAIAIFVAISALSGYLFNLTQCRLKWYIR
jgi:CDP-diacylglycerol--serine O-phosphatidyltransferase